MFDPSIIFGENLSNFTLDEVPFGYLTNVAKLPRVQEVTNEWKKRQKAT